MSQHRLGGPTAVARELTETRGKLVTRQGVYMWWRRRDRNGFPERVPILTPGRKNPVRELFDIDAILIWYDAYMSKPWQGRRK